MWRWIACGFPSVHEGVGPIGLLPMGGEQSNRIVWKRKENGILAKEDFEFMFAWFIFNVDSLGVWD